MHFSTSLWSVDQQAAQKRARIRRTCQQLEPTNPPAKLAHLTMRRAGGAVWLQAHRVRVPEHAVVHVAAPSVLFSHQKLHKTFEFAYVGSHHSSNLPSGARLVL